MDKEIIEKLDLILGINSEITDDTHDELMEQILALFESNTQEKECKHKWVNRSEYDERKVCSKCNQNKPHGF